jgi:hypothetical protein
LSSNDFRDLLASSLAAALVGATIWVPHWQWLARRLDGDLPDGEFRALYAVRRRELLTVTFLLGGLAALTTLWVLGGALSAALQATYAAATVWLPLLGPALACAAAAAYHGRYYLKVEASEQSQRFERLPAPRIIPRPARPGPWTAAPKGPAWIAPQPTAIPASNSGQPPGPPAALEQTASWPAPQPPSTPISHRVRGFGEGGTGPASAGLVQFCGKCGTPSQPDDHFCRACGAPFTAPQSATTAA